MKEMTQWVSFHSTTGYASHLLPPQDPTTSRSPTPALGLHTRETASSSTSDAGDKIKSGSR